MLYRAVLAYGEACPSGSWTPTPRTFLQIITAVYSVHKSTKICITTCIFLGSSQFTNSEVIQNSDFTGRELTEDSDPD